jgi:hypothetical protein
MRFAIGDDKRQLSNCHFPLIVQLGVPKIAQMPPIQRFLS